MHSSLVLCLNYFLCLNSLDEDSLLDNANLISDIKNWNPKVGDTFVDIDEATSRIKAWAITKGFQMSVKKREERTSKCTASHTSHILALEITAQANFLFHTYRDTEVLVSRKTKKVKFKRSTGLQVKDAGMQSKD